ncbi:MAG: nucleotidyltransferase domain-containing protein [Chloroflexi bacterium]|nr:nucleotidyltransferase domain-containing protein [Chloroflexota bacterium]
MNLDDLRSKRQQILELAARHGAANVRVFGSVIRAATHAGSDVDFLIDIVDLSRFAWGGGGLVVELQALIGCEIDLVTEKDLHWYIRERVLKEAAAL